MDFFKINNHGFNERVKIIICKHVWDDYEDLDVCFLKEEKGKEDRSFDNILASKGGCFGAPTCRNGHPSRTTRHPIYRIILILR